MQEIQKLPQARIEPARILRNVLVDSRRWDDVVFRDDDIVVATWSKSGTTWMQQIVCQLVTGGDPEAYGQAMSPWIDARMMDDAIGVIEAQEHRRFLKTHLPADAMPIDPRVRYIVVDRDARDVFWSWHHHYCGFSDWFYAMINAVPDRQGPQLPRPEPDVRKAYLHWLKYDDEPSGAFWPHIQSWWDIRDRPNVLHVHYNNLKSDLEGEVRRVAEFLEIEIDEDMLPAILDHCGIDHMREVAKQAEFLDMAFDGGAGTFINKGTNGRWRDVLSDQEIAFADEKAAEQLTPDCAHWLRTGELP